MSWQEAVLNKIHFNAFIAAIAAVCVWLWISYRIPIAGISALIIAVYFFFLLIVYFYNNYQHNVYLERQEQKNKKHEEEQWQLEKTKVEYWYAAISPILRSELLKLLSYDSVGNDPHVRICHRERGEFFHYDPMTFILPGSDLFRGKYAVIQIQVQNGNDIYFIHPHLYTLLISSK